MRARRIEVTDQRERREFWEVAERLYADDDRWIHPLRSDQRFMMDVDHHPFYAHSEAAFFLVEDDGTPVGRVAILNNVRYRSFHNDDSGFFTLFECINDDEAASALLDIAFRWARQRGIHRLVGPRGFIQGEAAGLLIDGFEERLPMGLNYNPPYYDRLLHAQGFQKLTDYHTGYLTGEYAFPERVARIAAQIRQRRGYRVHVLQTEDEMRSLIPHVHRIYNEAFTAVPGYYPMTEAEIRVMGQRIISLTRPELIKLVYKDDVIHGFMIAYPNIAPALRKVRGRMFPFGWLRLLLAKRASTWLDFNGVGILPRFQGTGANAVMYDEMWKTLKEGPYDHGLAVQIREENDRSLADVKTLGVTFNILHRLYHRHLG